MSEGKGRRKEEREEKGKGGLCDTMGKRKRRRKGRDVNIGGSERGRGSPNDIVGRQKRRMTTECSGDHSVVSIR